MATEPPSDGPSLTDGRPADASSDLADLATADLPAADLGPALCVGDPAFGDEDGDGVCGCDEPSALADDFGDGQLGEAWDASWANDGASHEEAGGRLTFVLPAGQAGASAGLSTVKRYAIRGEAVWVEAPQQVDDASEASLMIGSAAGEIGLGRHRGELRCWTTAAGATTDLARDPYEPAAHRFWRLAVDGAGQPSCAVSADGKTWQTVGTAQGVVLDAAWLRLQVYARGGLSGASVSFDNFNVDPAGLARPPSSRDGRRAPCATATLVDEFGDRSQDERWSPWADPPTTVEIVAGALQVSTSGAPGSGGYTSRGVFSLAASRLRVEIGASTGAIEQTLQLSNGEQWIRIKLGADAMIRAAHGDASAATTVGEVEHVPADHRYWSIREQAGQVIWETSADGASWDPLGAAPLALERWYRISLFAGRDQPGGAGVARFDNLNYPP